MTIDPHITPTTMCSDIILPSAHVGIETTGSTYRMDGVVLETRKLVDPPKTVKTDVEILSALLKRVKSLKR
jgi:formylmethanofuran dehydrogenase subunit B